MKRTGKPRVYRVGKGAMWHWGQPSSRGLISTCAGWDIADAAGADPGSVGASGRCTGKGCRERWALWGAELHGEAT